MCFAERGDLKTAIPDPNDMMLRNKSLVYCNAAMIDR